MRKNPQPPPGRETRVPDMNAGAPRPEKATEDKDLPTMDRPPRRQGGDRPGFDRGVSEADREARGGTVPGPDDFEAQQKEGGEPDET